ncbi:MAG TPA: FAD/NAD(P)-binding oxidoreductase [Candidatus Dormibacteraeota bacterium]|nr:FAD/NAD(P)-binding oxidoreductase [Candidatus Dormibacteraeota bacterium]
MSDRKHGPAETVVVLGGGVGGVAAANRLRRRLDRRHRVILVNRDADFTFAASFLWVMSGKRRPTQVTRPLLSLQRRGIEVVVGDIEAIDPATRTVTVDGTQITAGHLVVSLGADYAAETIPGLQAAGETFATLDGAQRLTPAVKALTRGQVLVVTAAPLYRCPAAPYEAALLIDAMLRRNGVRKHVDIALHSAEPGPMAVAGANVSAAVIAILADRGIDYHSSHQITAVEPGRADFADGQSETFDMLVYMPPIRPPAVIASSPLAGAGGWIDADRHTLATAFAGVYAIGDNAQLPLSIGKPLPRAGVFAHAQALVVADNIAATIDGRSATARFDGHGGCFIETGFGKAGYGSGDFYAEPSPAVIVRPPSRRWHLGKVAFEYRVMKRWL